MKKYAWITVIIGCISGMIFLYKHDQKQWDNLKFSSTTLMYQMSQNEIEAMGISINSLNRYAGYASLSILETERIFMFDTHEVEQVKQCISTYLKGLELNKEALWYCEDSYIFVVVSQNKARIMKELKEYR